MSPFIHAVHATHGIAEGTRVLVPQFAVITASASGNNEVVAAVTGKRIRVLAYNYVASGTVNAAWRSGAATVIGGLGYWVANTGKVVPFNPVGWFETAVGEALNLNLSGAVSVGGELVFVVVD